MEHFYCVTVLAAARDLLTNSISQWNLAISEIARFRQTRVWIYCSFFFLFICHNLRKGLLAAQTILISMPLSIPYLPCSQSISVDFKGIISKIPNFQFFCLQKEHLLNAIFCVDSPAAKITYAYIIPWQIFKRASNKVTKRFFKSREVSLATKLTMAKNVLFGF